MWLLTLFGIPFINAAVIVVTLAFCSSNKKKNGKKSSKNNKKTKTSTLRTEEEKKNKTSTGGGNKAPKKKSKKKTRTTSENQDYPAVPEPTKSAKKRRQIQLDKSRKRKIAEGFYQSHSDEDDTLEAVKSLASEKTEDVSQ